MELEKVKIRRIIGPTPAGAAVLLGNDEKTFVVFIGYYEAAALIREINKDPPARPLTHELIHNVFLGFDIKVKKIIISTIIESTFCANLILEQRVKDKSGNATGWRNEVRIDARPSDCFVLALKSGVDIYVTRDVFEEVRDVSGMTEEVEGSLATGQLGSCPGEGDPFQADEQSTPDDFLSELEEGFGSVDDDDEGEEWKKS